MSLPAFLENLDPNIYLSDNYVVLDFEVDTSHGDYGHPVHPDNKLLLGCWKLGPEHAGYGAMPEWGDGACQWLDEYGLDRLIRLIYSADFLVCHNCKYELGWLRRGGLDLHRVLVFDTKVAEYVLLGNLAAPSEYGAKQLATSLDMVCRRRGLPIKDPAVDLLMGHGINPARVPQPWLQGRCKQDVDTTERVMVDQRAALERRSLLPVHYTRCLLTPVLADIEPEGMALDPERVEETYAEYHGNLQQLEKQMQEFTGGINWRSHKQLAKYLYDTLDFAEVLDSRGKPCRTDGGARCTDKKTLERLEATTARQEEFLALRKKIGKVASALSKALEFYIGVVREKGGTFYAELNQTVTATGRLSSTGMPLKFEMFDKPKTAQFQNQPRIFKRLFKPKREGWLMGDPDGSSLEFRVAAQLGGPDPDALADIESGWDVHVFTASVLNDKSLDEIRAEVKEAQAAKRDDLRQLAKPDTFKPLYGGTKGTPAQERYYAAFRLRYPGIAAAQESWVREVVNTKKLVTPWGMIYYWPTAKARRDGSVNVKSAVFNYPIQALATAEIVPIAVVYLWHRINSEGLDDRIRIVNLVHDNSPAEVHPEAADQFVVLAKQAYTHDVYNYLEKVYGIDFKVPLGVGIKIGTHWGDKEATEYQFNVWKNGREERVK